MPTSDLLGEIIIIFSNVMFIPPIFIFLWKRCYLVSLYFVGLTVASTIYHICYLPLHLVDVQYYYFANACPVADTMDYGIVLLFFDYLFATTCTLHMVMFLAPRTEKDMPVHRMFFVVISMAIIVVIAFNVGFFPSVNGGSVVSLTTESPTISKFIQFRHTGLWKKIVNYMSVLSHLERSTYIKTFAFVYGSVILLIHFIVYLFNYHAERSLHGPMAPKSDGVFHNVGEKIWYFYTTRYHKARFVASLCTAFVAFFLWVVLQRIFENYYLRIHGGWHFFLGIGASTFGLSIILKNKGKIK